MPALWASLEGSQVWGPFVDAAVNCKFEVMRKLPEIVKAEGGTGKCVAGVRAIGDCNT